jgi:hypothetical protein
MLLEPFLTLLALLARNGENDKIGEIYQSSIKLFGRARMAVNNFNVGGSAWDRGRASGKANGKESVEDFLQRMHNIRSGYDVDVSLISPDDSQDFDASIK